MTRLKTYLHGLSGFALTIFLALTSFSTYFCMYAFRKPFTAGTFEGVSLWGIDYKIILVIAQIMGYATAKGLGIKVVSEVTPDKRAKYILCMIGYSELALLLFALVPAPDNWMFMYLNGLGLGMIYGLVFSYLEGRQITEVLGAGLAVSFIVSSGLVKTVGRWVVVDLKINEYWMPFMTGLMFLPLLVISVWLMNNAPKPTPEDIALRTPRIPMSGKRRVRFVRKYGFGLVSLILIYVLMTVFRDIRDNFSVEIWKELGVNDATIFSSTEAIIGLAISLLAGLVFFVKNHQTAFWLNHAFLIVGSILIVGSTVCFERQILSAFWWTVLMGLGIYLAYVPFNGMLFERLIAVLHEKANVGFLFYIADFSGYMGSVVILLIKNFSSDHSFSWLGLLIDLAHILPFISVILAGISLFYFSNKLGQKPTLPNSSLFAQVRSRRNSWPLSRV
ncbi:hypothetical protein SAMN04515674_10474 [Pseudarcicella hirudinis]|uniref:MFS transporter n=1 Tax=Pseudarcicella hirudinis TaxID=1079859 RepID=A0A1I5RH45_9BACT|nr:DUF5690 family protein [Pseudarcicella hirudinis]SFP57835.1 hypothetical protein SAMN04515674_10474 [Pseudarcicella hirudinis]